MPANFSKRTSANLINETLKQERNYTTSLKKKIEMEEHKIKDAVKSELDSEKVKAIKDKIKNLTACLNNGNE